MAAPEKLQEAKTRTYELAGRNLILIQQLERLLKEILPAATLEGSSASELASAREGNRTKIEEQTLGNLVKRFSEEVLTDEETPSTNAPTSPGRTFSLRFVVPSAEAKKKREQNLQGLVASRNRLVHHLFADLVPDDPDSWLATHPFLEQLEHDVLREIQTLQNLVSSSQWVHQLLRDPEIRREILRGHETEFPAKNSE